LDSSGVLTPEARKCHFSAACEACSTQSPPGLGGKRGCDTRAGSAEARSLSLRTFAKREIR
jgi:hypothetical protein